MINKGFFSETFLEEYKNTKLTDIQKEYIENFSYGLSILSEDLSEENRAKANKKYLLENFETVLQGLSFNDFKIENELFVLFGSKSNEKKAVIVLDFVSHLKDYSDSFGEFKEINAINYAKENNIKLAIITDGFKWRVYRIDVANYFETYIEFNIKDYTINPNADDINIKLFIDLLYGENYLTSEENPSYCIDTLFEKNDKAIENIEKELKSKMEDILSGIGLGFKEHIGKEKFEDQERKELYRDSITVLYRTLFILYAETKGIFEINDKVYKENSLLHLINDIPNLFGQLDKIGNNYDLWERLSTLFSWINEGKNTADFNFTAYNGGLFSNQNRNILSNHKINNRNLIKTLGKLGYYGKDDFSVKINFNDITTRSFGTLYEGILDYNMFIAEEDLLKRTEKNKIVYIPLKDANAKKTELINIIKKGEIYLSGDALERKETGAYYTPEPIVEYIVSNTVDIKVKEKLEELQTLLNPILEDLKITVNPLSENGLKVRVLETIEKFVKENILTLSVLDNAMGSGHFLVNAAYHISNLIFSFVHKNISFSVEDYENKDFTSYQYWKRQVVSHNIYGVDINELAVQLGKLSLWLISASKDKPLSFIDHHIKCGNSLIGASSKDIDEVLGEKVGLFDSSLDTLMHNLEIEYSILEKMPENTADEVHEKERYYEGILNELELVKKKWDIFLAMKLIDKKGKVDKDKYSTLASSYDLEKIKYEYRVHFEQWEELSKENQFFHWELEFPEVFKAKEKGFDCIIGNPPYGAKLNDNLKPFIKTSYYSAITSKKDQIKGSLDTFSLFIDKSLCTLASGAVFAYIVPLALTSSEQLTALHKMLFDNLETIYISNYSNRPKKIFPNADQRVSIVIGKNKGEKLKEIFTTKVNKRYKEKAIAEVLEKMSYVNSKEFILYGRIPKIGTEIEYDILKKIFNYQMKLKDLISHDGKPVYYRSAGGRYYNIVTSYSTGSSAEKYILIKDNLNNFIGALLSSNFYFWFYHIYSDTLNLKLYELEVLPIPIEKLDTDLLNSIEENYENYLNDLEKNSKIVNANYSNVSSFKEYKARKSKYLIDKLDLAIQVLYGFTDEETNFLINYDIEFRTDEEVEV